MNNHLDRPKEFPMNLLLQRQPVFRMTSSKSNRVGVPKRTLRKGLRGFSLFELLAAITIITILSGLTITSSSGFRSSLERRQAVDKVMNTVERARLAALQSGSDVHVVMALSKDGGSSSDALIVVGESPLSSSETTKVLYTPWTLLPGSVHFLNSAATLAQQSLPKGVSPETDLPKLPGSNYSYSGFTFNSTGQVTYPADVDLVLALLERTKKDNGIYDLILLSRYSGRIRTLASSLASLGSQ